MNPIKYKIRNNNDILLSVLYWMYIILLVHKKKSLRWLHRQWYVRPINQERDRYGDYKNLFQKLRNDRKMFYRYTSMTVEHFEKFVELTTSHLKKQSTRALIPEHRLIIALRLLLRKFLNKMSDHENYCNNYVIENSVEDVKVFNNDPESVIEEKKADEFLIELYRERPFLYDKQNPNFKNTLMKGNAWNEMSKIMIATNCGDIYTPQYCQRRCISLREQYNREKKRRESQFKNGNGVVKSQFLFYSQLKFLDQVIKRRSISNAKSQASASFIEKSETEAKMYNSDISACSSNYKESTNTIYKQNIDNKNSHQDVLKSSPKRKKRKINETKELEQTFLNIGNRIMNYMETPKQYTPDDAFIEFIKIQLDSVPDSEKNIRRKMIMDALSAPLKM